MEEHIPLHMPETDALPPENQEAPAPQPTPAQNLFREGVELVKSLFWVLVTVTLIRSFVFQPYDVRGASMEPNLHESDYLIADKFTYRLSEPKRGDVIVLFYPLDRTRHYVKRVIGLPGETVVITAGKVYLKGTDGTLNLLEEPYLDESVFTTAFGDAESREYIVPNEQYFVLGDNRQNSSDSREWGFLPEKDIAGIVRLRAMPLNKFGLISHAKS
jgi:signal peptidase I